MNARTGQQSGKDPAAARRVRTSDARDRPADIQVHLLGPLLLTMDGQPLTRPEQRRARVRQLLGLLVLLPTITRDQAMVAMWPDLKATNARNNLRVTLSHLRRLLEPERPAGEPSGSVAVDSCGHISLNSDSGVMVDVWLVQRHYAIGRRHQRNGARSNALRHYDRIVQAWRGDAVDDLRYIDAGEPALSQLNRTLMDATCRSGELNLRERRTDIAIARGNRALSHDPSNERAHRIVITGHLVAGERGQALEAAARCRAVTEDLGMSLTAKTHKLMGLANYRAT